MTELVQRDATAERDRARRRHLLSRSGDHLHAAVREDDDAGDQQVVDVRVFEVGPDVVAPDGPMARLLRSVSRGRALEILLVADDVDGPRAAQYGYVNRVIADDQLDNEVDRIASRLARFDHEAIARTKSYSTR